MEKTTAESAPGEAHRERVATHNRPTGPLFQERLLLAGAALEHWAPSSVINWHVKQFPFGRCSSLRSESQRVWVKRYKHSLSVAFCVVFSILHVACIPATILLEISRALHGVGQPCAVVAGSLGPDNQWRRQRCWIHAVHICSAVCTMWV